MNELTSPFVRLWHWISTTGGFPGQVLFCCAVVMLVLALIVWFTNRRG